jgi:hypothetical protein
MNARRLALTKPEMCGVPDYLKDQARTMPRASWDSVLPRSFFTMCYQTCADMQSLRLLGE